MKIAIKTRLLTKWYVDIYACQFNLFLDVPKVQLNKKLQKVIYVTFLMKSVM